MQQEISTPVPQVHKPTPIKYTHAIKVSDLLWATATSVIDVARKAGITISISAVYNENNLKSLAFIAGLLRQMAEESSPGNTINILQKQ